MCFRLNITKSKKVNAVPAALKADSVGELKKYRYRARGNRSTGMVNKAKRIGH